MLSRGGGAGQADSVTTRPMLELRQIYFGQNAQPSQKSVLGCSQVSAGLMYGL